MKKVLTRIGLVLALVLIGVAIYRLALRRQTASQAGDEIVSDSVFTPLPSDPKLAQKEIQRVQKALARLKPNTPYVVIDTHANKFYLRTEDSVLFQAVCSTGSGGELVDSLTNRRWIFNTPRGAFKVNSKLEDPWWRKPDWAFIEEGEKIPKDPSQRFDPEMLGEYAMGFGDGYFIHGTIYKRLLGINVTHGCVRLGDDDLKYVWNKIKIGTPVYIF